MVLAEEDAVEAQGLRIDPGALPPAELVLERGGIEQAGVGAGRDVHLLEDPRLDHVWFPFFRYWKINPPKPSVAHAANDRPADPYLGDACPYASVGFARCAMFSPRAASRIWTPMRGRTPWRPGRRHLATGSASVQAAVFKPVARPVC
ncbi:hypothetical protein [Ralstonia pseudosolanacearum]|uniref:hypothetical protein n=1 Tax=Ralstonia pseudosolanacearum TaxID=1310165 RepID=UPI003221DDA9